MMNWFQWLLFVVTMLLKYGPKVLAMAVEVYNDVKQPRMGVMISSTRDLFAEEMRLRLEQMGKPELAENLPELRKYAEMKTTRSA